MSAIGSALSGLQASMVRLNVTASNIANANTTGPVPGASAVSPSGGGSSGQAYRPLTTQQSETPGGGTAAKAVAVAPSFIPTYDPGSIHADPSGMVAAPNVDVADQLVEQRTAMIAYEANLKVMQTANRMNETSLEIWG